MAEILPIADCNHIWEPTDTEESGEPSFRKNRYMWAGLRAHVCCSECNCRTWLTKEEWDALEAPTEEGREDG